MLRGATLEDEFPALRADVMLSHLPRLLSHKSLQLPSFSTGPKAHAQGNQHFVLTSLPSRHSLGLQFTTTMPSNLPYAADAERYVRIAWAPNFASLTTCATAL